MLLISIIINVINKQVRLETASRILNHALTPDGKPEKWWMSFAKKKFMGLSLSQPGRYKNIR